MAVNFVCVEHHAYSPEQPAILNVTYILRGSCKGLLSNQPSVFAHFLDASNASFWGSTMMRVGVHPQVSSSTVSRQKVLAFVNGIK